MAAHASERGTALLDLCVALSLVLLLTGGLLTTAYFALTRIWLDHVTYETLMCLSEQRSAPACTREARKAVDRVLPIGQLVELRATRHRGVRVQYRFRIHKDLAFSGERSLLTPRMHGGAP